MPVRRWPKVGDVLTHKFRGGRTVEARVVDVDPERGTVTVTVDGTRYESLSQAATALSGHAANGWAWWRPGQIQPVQSQVDVDREVPPVATKPGTDFEQQVAAWVMTKAFAKLLDSTRWRPVAVETNKPVFGSNVRRPYEVDVCVELEANPGWLGRQRAKRYIWIECKDLRSRSISKHDVSDCR